MIDQSMSPPDKLIDAVRRATRRAGFDFAAAAVEVRKEASEALQSYSSTSQGSGEQQHQHGLQWCERAMTLTADECREIFSMDFKAKTEDFETQLPQQQQDPVRDVLSIAMSDKITYDDILKIQEELEGAVRQNYERVFQRVYQSLGLHEQQQDEHQQHGAFNRLPPTNEVMMAMERRAAEKAQKEREALIAEQERQEAERLRVERDRLRRRFDDDSEDAQGVDPFQHASTTSASLPREQAADGDVFDRIRAFVSGQGGANDEEEEETGVILPSMRTMTSFFDSPEFEAVLVEVERELEISADDKFGSAAGEEGESELAEVLRILDSAPRVAAHRDADDNEFNQLLSKMWPQPQVKPVVAQQEPVQIREAVKTVSESQPLPPPPPAASRAPVAAGPRGGRMFDAYAHANNSDGSDESEEGGDSGEDSGLDEDWNKRRSAMKSSHKVSYSEQAPPLPPVWTSGEVPSLRTRRAKRREDMGGESSQQQQKSVASRVDAEDSEEETSSDPNTSAVNAATSTKSTHDATASAGDDAAVKEAEVVAKVVITESEVVADRGGIFGSLAAKPNESPSSSSTSTSTGTLRGGSGLRPGGAAARMQGRFASSISAAKSQSNAGPQT